MKILIPSYNRAGLVSAIEHLPSAKIVVPESQRQGYEKYYRRDQLIFIPDRWDGNVAKKRNAILNLCEPDEVICIADDDFIGLKSVKYNKFITEPEEMIESLCQTIQYSDYYLGGFNNTIDPMKFRDFNPFSITKPSFGTVVIKVTDLRYDESLTRHEDTDFYFETLHTHRGVFRDNRFAPVHKDPIGGIGSGETSHRECSTKLVNKWGSEFIRVNPDGSIKGVTAPIKGI